MQIEQGRHPVVEQVLQTPFVANDLNLDDDTRMLVITGPNMGGKSTYMRQTALIVLLAQIGSFVPAKACELSLVDRIFTRIGSSDDLAGGRSTFMVEMSETANILHNASDRSLVLMDEVGRGTSTFRWLVTGLGGCRAPGQAARLHLVRDALLRAHRAAGKPAGGGQRAPVGHRAQRSHRLPSPRPAGTGEARVMAWPWHNWPVCLAR
jgi:hypothetical protein